MEEIQIITVTPDNVNEVGFVCVKDKKSPGYRSKLEWFLENYKYGLKLKIAVYDGQQVGFIEYIPAEYAFRPVKADNYLFIHCIVNFSKQLRSKRIASILINSCESDARNQNKSGVCVMTSSGVWMADKSLFEKNDYKECERLGRFELMVKKFDETAPNPVLLNWEENQSNYQGWNLLYSNQCPWHIKSVTDLSDEALAHGIELKTINIGKTSDFANIPSGFGTFALLKDGKLLEDHYISRTRFVNILKKELK